MSKRCPFCIAKDDEIARLHRLVEKLSMRPPVLPPAPVEVGPTTMQSLAEQAELDDGDAAPFVGSIPISSIMQAFDSVHGEYAWASLAGVPPEKEAS